MRHDIAAVTATTPIATPTSRLISVLITVLIIALAVAACSSAPAPSGVASASGHREARSAPAASSAPPTGAEVDRTLVDRFVAAVNRGDREAVGSLFAEDARFDSVGRIYRGRSEIMDRFLGPEVIEAGGRYRVLSVRAGARGRTVAEYDFTTGGGLREHFTYDCAEEGERFADCVGRYV